ncbi:NAD-dependent epimerase/dehydratase family protein [Hyphomonas sp.]|uniref:NAD-dependent epimerase/dehydratase family protein n=1 Tax=Hyphomonas sp. TaxID=87 RepID=UPI0032EDE904
MQIDTVRPVLVTGATGYVAGWIIKALLDKGVTVHAAVRDPSLMDKRAHLDEIAENTPGNIRYFKSNLLEDGSYAEAMADCATVFHTASPFTVDVKDPQTQLVDPAILGTRNVLTEATKTPTVKRVVVTSSCAAIYGDNADISRTKNGVFTEDDWNETSSLKHNPYAYSKTLAEREAWSIADSQSQWDLVVVNPCAVMGPGLNPHATSDSFNIIRQMGDGTLKAGVPDWGMGAVDVRDVAQAHLAAAFTPEASGRYIVCGHNSSFPEMANQLLEKYGDDYPIPRKHAPKFLVWLLGPLMGGGLTRRMIARNVGYPWIGDNSKGVRELGMTYRPLAETMNDFFQQMIDTEQLGAKK